MLRVIVDECARSGGRRRGVAPWLLVGEYTGDMGDTGTGTTTEMEHGTRNTVSDFSIVKEAEERVPSERSSVRGDHDV